MTYVQRVGQFLSVLHVLGLLNYLWKHELLSYELEPIVFQWLFSLKSGCSDFGVWTCWESQILIEKGLHSSKKQPRQIYEMNKRGGTRGEQEIKERWLGLTS